MAWECKYANVNLRLFQSAKPLETPCSSSFKSATLRDMLIRDPAWIRQPHPRFSRTLVDPLDCRVWRNLQLNTFVF